MAAEETLNISVRLKDLASAQFKSLAGTVQKFGSGAVGAFKGVTGAVFSLKTAVTGTIAALGARALTNLGKEAVETAGNLQGLETAFGNLTKEIGGAEDVLKALRKGTRDTVSDFKLFETANKAILFDIARSPAEFEKLVTTARRLGRAVGRDTVDAFADLAVGIGRQSRLILDNLGIIVSEEEAYKDLAKSLNVTVLSLTEAQKRQAFLNVTLAAAEKLTSSLGEDVLSLSDEYGRLTAELENTKNLVLKDLTPAFTELIKGFADTIKQNKPEILNFFADVIENAGKLATIIGKTFEGIRATINFTQDTISTFKLGDAANEVASLEKTIASIDKRLGKLSADQLKSKPAIKLIGDRSEVEADLRLAKATLSSLQSEYEKLTQAQSAQSALATGEIEASALKAATSLRALAEENRRALQPAKIEIPNPFAAISRGAAVARKAIDDAAKAEKQAAIDFAETREARSDAASERIAAANEAFDAEEKLNSLAAERSKFIQEQLKEQAALANALRETRLEIDQTSAAILAERNAAFGAAKAFQTLRLDSEKFGLAAQDAILGVADSLTGNLSDGILDVIEGQKKLKDVFRDTARSILNDIARVIVQTLVLKAVQGSLGGLGGAIGFDKGGVFPGGLKPVRGLARGDVISPPGGVFQLAEKGRSEAVLPLVRGRNGDLGVQAQGGGQPQGGPPSITVIQNFNGLTIGEKALFERNKQEIEQAVAQKYAASATYRDQLRAA